MDANMNITGRAQRTMKSPGIRIGLLSVLLLALAGSVLAGGKRDYLIIVGSTTVYPFSSQVVERFVDQGYKRPQVQPTGSGGGFMLFCNGTTLLDPDITYSSRRMRQTEFDRCRENGVEQIVEVKLGYDGIVFVVAGQGELPGVTPRDIYLGLAGRVPDPSGREVFIANPYTSWRQVNAELPDRPIRVYGPAAGSGTRHVFARLAMEGGCRTFDWVRALKREDAYEYKKACRSLREDGAYQVIAEDDDKALQQLEEASGSVAILSFSVLEKNRARLRVVPVEGALPDFDTIAEGNYPVARPLYLYAKVAQVDVVPGMREFLAEFTREKAWGSEGYLTSAGLVPMTAEERRYYAREVELLQPMSM
jgi:phosphate transport system substrate-binding protein